MDDKKELQVFDIKEKNELIFFKVKKDCMKNLKYFHAMEKKKPIIKTGEKMEYEEQK